MSAPGAAASSAKSQEALARELEYQKNRAQEMRVAPTSQAVLQRYRENKLWRYIQKEFMYKSLGDVRGKTVLDFACGEGQLSTQIAALGAHVTGIDISEELIAVARRRAELDGVTSRCEFRAFDLLKDPPKPDSFDILFCSDALHHVDIRTVLPALLACLKPGGKAIIGEPVSLSRTLEGIREKVPVAREASPDDRNLTRDELDYVASQFNRCALTYFNLFSRLTRFVPNATRIDQGHRIARATVIGLAKLDRLVSMLPGMARFFGVVVIVGEKPQSPKSAA